MAGSPTRRPTAAPGSHERRLRNALAVVAQHYGVSASQVAEAVVLYCGTANELGQGHPVSNDIRAIRGTLIQ